MRNQLKWGVILSFLTTAINMAIQLLYTPIMIRILGQSEYGLYTLVGSVVSYLSLFSFGFTGAYLYFYSRYKNENNEDSEARLNGLFLLVFLCMAIVALVFGMLLTQNTALLFGNKLTAKELDKAIILMRILVVNISLTFPTAIFDSIVGAHEQYIFQRLIALCGIVFNPFISLPLLLMGRGSIALVCVTTMITICKLLFNCLFCICKLHVRFTFSNLNFTLLREIANYSFFLFLNMIVDQINWMVDKVILGHVVGTVAVAIYGVGAQINALYMQFSNAISSVFSPKVNRIAAEGKEDMLLQFTELFIKVGRLQFLVLMLIVSGFIIFGEFFITEVYVTNEYKDAYEIALMLIIPVTIPLIQNVGIEIQRALNKHRVRTAVYTVMAFLNIGISIPFTMAYGPLGSALGTSIGLVVANVLFMNVYYKKTIGIDIIGFWKSILSFSKGLIIPGIIGFFIVHYVEFSSLKKYLLWIITYSAIYILSMWLFGMNRFEKDLIIQPVKIICKKLK